MPHKIRHFPWHPLSPKKLTSTRHPRISLQIRHPLHHFRLPPQIHQFTFHILPVRLRLHQRCQCISAFTFLHFLLDACLIGFSDLVITVEDEGGSSCPELPSFWSSVWKISGEVNLRFKKFRWWGDSIILWVFEDGINTREDQRPSFHVTRKLC